MQGLLQSNFSTGDSKRSSVPGVVFSDPDLLVAQRLSQHIAGGMDELVALSHKSARDMERSLGMPPPYKVRRLHKTDSTGSYHSPKPVCLPASLLNMFRSVAHLAGPHRDMHGAT